MSQLDSLNSLLSEATRPLPPPSMRRALRDTAGISRADIAAAVGVTRQTIRRWEIGSHKPRGDKGRAYRAVLAQLSHLQHDEGA